MILLLFCFISLVEVVKARFTLIETILSYSPNSKHALKKREELRKFIIEKEAVFNLDLIAKPQHWEFLKKIKELYRPSAAFIYQKLFFTPYYNYHLLVTNVLHEIWLTLRYPQNEKEFFCPEFYCSGLSYLFDEFLSCSMLARDSNLSEIFDLVALIELRCDTTFVKRPKYINTKVTTCPFNTQSEIIKKRWLNLNSFSLDADLKYNINENPYSYLRRVATYAKSLLKTSIDDRTDPKYLQSLHQLYLLHDYFAALTYIEHSKLFKLYQYKFIDLFELVFKKTIAFLAVAPSTDLILGNLTTKFPKEK